MRPKTTTGQRHESQLAINLRRLIDHMDNGSVNAWGSRYGLNQTTVNRAANGTSDPSVGQLTKWANAIGCPPEQLLRSDFNPIQYASIPDTRARRAAELFAALKTEEDRRLVEALLIRLSPSATTGEVSTPTKKSTRRSPSAA